MAIVLLVVEVNAAELIGFGGFGWLVGLLVCKWGGFLCGVDSCLSFDIPLTFHPNPITSTTLITSTTPILPTRPHLHILLTPSLNLIHQDNIDNTIAID